MKQRLTIALVVWFALSCTSPAPSVPAPAAGRPDSTLPEWAAPRGAVVDPTRVDQSDVIPYRVLVRGDFKGRNAPAPVADVADRVGAATCAHIFTAPETQLQIEGTRSPGGSVRYRARAVDLKFYSQMDRNCSWWNPKNVGLSEPYLLQHEQIHFALFELQARAMNASLAEIEARIENTSHSIEGATATAKQRLEDQVQQNLNEVLARNHAFDSETSMGHHPEAQERWWRKVQAELAASAGD